MQFVKFGLVGLSNTLLTYVVYAILVTLGLHYQLSNVISYAAGIFNSYYWNNKYVFQEEEGQRRNHVKALAKGVPPPTASLSALGRSCSMCGVDVLGHLQLSGAGDQPAGDHPAEFYSEQAVGIP